MNENNIEDINFDEEDDKLALMPDRLSTMQYLKKSLPSLNIYLENFSLFLDSKEEIFTEELKKSGIEILKELSERINAIQRLNKVLETHQEEVFVSDIELCKEFIDDTTQFLKTIDNFKITNE
jgi:ABC-type uncharacterized transport system substrate-binding protein